ncbi:WecB/TagA/CpsF family glycosyltransferase [Acidimicrobiia bacterium EGI L10123]|uniref:WecB/TagA/CpsF family glycosyltransferase n=1 Tax=Salinilacustrithrix flava TaxID=2957203 RepID=UPI003D7C2E15|nr:WecB/TagA/CpsF family glycosyltransferase [Acidimicrobiia bacterium EGI L10123]
MSAPVDVVVVAHRSAATIDACVRSAVREPMVGSVFVVDSGSPDDSSAIARRAGARVLRAPNRGFGAGCNLGVGATTADHVLLLNPDAELRPGTLAALVDHLDRTPGCGLVSSDLEHPDGRREPVARRRPSVLRCPLEPGLAARLDAAWYQRRLPDGGPVQWLSGAALLARRTAFDEVHGFDERYFLYGEDADLCLRMQAAGWTTEWVPGCPTSHRSGTSTAGLGPSAKELWAQGWRRVLDDHHRHPSAARRATQVGLVGRAVVWTALGRRDRAETWARASRAMATTPTTEPRGTGRADRIALLGTAIDVVDLDGAVERIAAMAAEGSFRHVVTANVDFLRQADESSPTRAALRAADLVVPDGVPLLWMARWQRTPLRGRVNGTDLTVRLLERAGATGWTVCYVGGEPGVAAAAAEAAAGRWGTRTAGIRCPSPEEMDDPVAGREVAEWVRSTGADLVLLAIGGGRQERWVHQHRDALGDGVVIGVGSALDFVAGTRPRAPRWMQQAGLEWAWRLAQEPGRLWRRYLVEDPQVLLAFARERAAAR